MSDSCLSELRARFTVVVLTPAAITLALLANREDCDRFNDDCDVFANHDCDCDSDGENHYMYQASKAIWNEAWWLGRLSHHGTPMC